VDTGVALIEGQAANSPDEFLMRYRHGADWRQGEIASLFHLIFWAVQNKLDSYARGYRICRQIQNMPSSGETNG
jgi:hypothetical protein